MNTGLFAVCCWIILTIIGLVYFKQHLPSRKWLQKTFLWAESMRAYFFLVAALAAVVTIILGLIIQAIMG